MNKFVTFASAELVNSVTTVQEHQNQLMEAYGFDASDLAENGAGRVSERQLQAMKGFQRGKTGVLLLIIVVLVALPILSQFVPAIPPESIVVAAIGVPVLALWLLVDLVRRAFPGTGSVMQVEGHFRVDTEATLRTGRTTYNYLQQVTGSGMLHRYQRVGLLRRTVFQFNLIHENFTYRVYYFQNRNLSYVLSIEPLSMS